MKAVDYQLPGTFLEALKTRPHKEIEAIFEALTQKKLAEIPGCTTGEEMIRVQAQAQFAQELYQFFLSEMQRK